MIYTVSEITQGDHNSKKLTNTPTICFGKARSVSGSIFDKNIEDCSQTKLHKQKEKYEEGTGCDICKLETRRLSRYPVRPQDDVLQIHNYSSYEPHRRFSEYQEGTGCDVCKHFQPPHEQNKGHQKTLSRMKYLYNHKYIQTTRQKSARF